MKIKITIETENDAFYGDQLAPEVARILRKRAGTIERELNSGDEDFSVRLLDINGNKVGDCDTEP